MLTGVIEPRFANVRMGLAAHLEGVMNGILLMGFGAAWTKVQLGRRAHAIALGTLLYGTYANWAWTTLSAILGTVGLSPITAAGREAADPWKENLLLGGFLSVGVTMLTATVLVLWGLRRRTELATTTAFK